MREIWQFLAVLLAAIVAACALVFWMVSGEALDKRMYVSQVLLSPETIESLSNRAVVGGKDRPAEYMIESIRFTSFDESTKKWAEKRIDIGPYGKFYRTIEGDRGVIDPSESVLQSFHSTTAEKVAIYMKYFAPFVQEGKVELFQTLEINSSGDAYRINLHVDTSQMQWIYFNHPGIDKLAQEILLE